MKPVEAAVLGIGVLAFTPAMLELASVWSSVDYLSHGFLIPVVAGFVAAARRREWAALDPERDVRGLLLIAAGLLVSSLGLLAGHPSIVGAGVVGAAFGVALALRGSAGVELMRFPLSYLVFMIPPPPSWIQPVIVQLQLQVSAGAVAILRLGGMAILREGNVIVLPGGASLFVDEACSGITSVVTLIPLGILLAWTTEKTRPRRLFLIAWIVPAAMLGNLVRVTLTVWGAASHGVDLATSTFLHNWAGVGTYLLACGLLLGMSALMGRVLR